MATITIMDPVTRIEGHMKVELTIDRNNNRMEVLDARCSGTLLRGFERILAGRDPLDAPILTQRICGVCPVSHGMASVLALDAAAGMEAPANARLLRNLVLGANFLQSHILSFYLLTAPDYVRGPRSAPWTPAWEIDQRGGLTALADHLIPAVEARRRAHEMGAIFGGRMPSPHTFIPGGFTAVPTTERIDAFRAQLEWLAAFIGDIYVPDAEALDAVYSDYRNLGKGYGNLLAYGAFNLDGAGTQKLLQSGFVPAAAPGMPEALAESRITESVAYSWYDGGSGNIRPSSGQTRPRFVKGKKYSWLKAPRYGGSPAETGPLARMWINGDYRRGVSVMDRHLARAYEARKVAEAMGGWLDQLAPGEPVCKNYAVPSSGSGRGLTEAARGALGHWIRISGRKIANYQVVTPTCWNASPRDSKNLPGPLEQALVGTPIADPARPVEALRVIHSFDPCLACAVHVLRPNGKPAAAPAGRG